MRVEATVRGERTSRRLRGPLAARHPIAAARNLAIALAAAITMVPVWGSISAAPDPHSCSPSGKVILSTKLTCPNRPVDVVLAIDTGCPGSEFGVAGVSAVRIANPLPETIVPYTENAGPGQATGAVPQWTFDSAPAEGITVSHRIAATMPGRFLIGSRGYVEVEDSSGVRRVGKLMAETLVVAAECSRPRASTLYLPLAYRPHCVPTRNRFDVVVLMDRSGSMDAPGLDAAASGLDALLETLHPRHNRVGLVAFAENATLVAPLGSTRSEITAGLRTSELAPGTRIDRAIWKGLRELDGPRRQLGAKQVLILVTDGVQTGSGADSAARAAARAATQRGVTLLALAVGPSTDSELLGELTGPANVVDAPRPSDLPEAYRRLALLVSCSGGA